jgi:hypothetical protein
MHYVHVPLKGTEFAMVCPAPAVSPQGLHTGSPIGRQEEVLAEYEGIAKQKSSITKEQKEKNEQVSGNDIRLATRTCLDRASSCGSRA